MTRAWRLLGILLGACVSVTANAQSVSFKYPSILASEYEERMEAAHPCEESASAEWLPCLRDRLEEVDREIAIMILRAQNEVHSIREEGKVVYRSNIQAAQDHWLEYRKLQCWHDYGQEPISGRFRQAINTMCELRLSYLRMAEIEQSMFAIPR